MRWAELSPSGMFQMFVSVFQQPVLPCMLDAFEPEAGPEMIIIRNIDSRLIISDRAFIGGLPRGVNLAARAAPLMLPCTTCSQPVYLHNAAAAQLDKGPVPGWLRTGLHQNFSGT